MLGLPTASFANRYSQVADTEASAARERPRRTIITSSLLIPGDGEPLPNGALVVEGKTIIWVGDKADIPQEYTQSPHKSYHVPFMMPGLWDVHVHFLDFPSDPDQLPAVMALESLSEHPAGTGRASPSSAGRPSSSDTPPCATAAVSGASSPR